MHRSVRRPVAVLLSVASAAVTASPTLLFPADSPTEPKAVLLALGAVLFGLSVILARAEDAPDPRDDLSEE